MHCEHVPVAMYVIGDRERASLLTTLLDALAEVVEVSLAQARLTLGNLENTHEHEHTSTHDANRHTVQTKPGGAPLIREQSELKASQNKCGTEHWLLSDVLELHDVARRVRDTVKETERAGVHTRMRSFLWL